MDVTLTAAEMAELFLQPARTKRDGGYQSLLVRLQERIDRTTGRLILTARDIERIPRYAFDYGVGGWEARLMSIFGRSLGSKLGRQDAAMRFVVIREIENDCRFSETFDDEESAWRRYRLYFGIAMDGPDEDADSNAPLITNCWIYSIASKDIPDVGTLDASDEATLLDSCFPANEA